MATFQLTDLLVEYQHAPVGIDEARPRFSWKAAAEGRGWKQASYRIVCKTGNALVWDSGEVCTDNALNIVYSGAALEPCTAYRWTLTVTDTRGQSVTASSGFETGLMDPSQAAWEGAQWIGPGDEDLTFAAHYLSVFRIDIPMTHRRGLGQGRLCHGRQRSPADAPRPEHSRPRVRSGGELHRLGAGCLLYPRKAALLPRGL